MDGEDCFGDADRQLALYEDPQLSRLHRAASAIEARHYCKETRIREIILNEAETQLNVLCGLCVGHDSVFTMVSRAPVTTLIVKDRVLAHNPVAALYCQYIRRTMLPEDA